MAFIIRLAFFAVVLGAVGCATPPGANECSTGITCPEGTKCAAIQQICITNDCGDGIVQSSEQCDDGNILDGDGCAANCLSREQCGDGVLNSAAGELCDDGNTTGGDGCASDCKSVEICGNGSVDVNEACDDGNTKSGDGCSGNCNSTEVCGNGIKDINEKCDDGSTPGGCNDDCQGGIGCGDGAIDRDALGNALEECDDGNSDNQDDCTNLCNLNTCGDGIVQTSGARVEQCDPSANFGETAACNLDCTTSTCGDNKINNAAGEECDAGAGMNGDDRDCTAACHLNTCGDGLHNLFGPNNAEDCDDGNSVQTDGCSNECTMPTCGNGVIEMGEACDDSNTTNGDGCSGPGSPGCQFETCGDGIKNNGEDCDAGSGGVAAESSTCNIDCTTRSCGDAKVNKTAGEQCDDPSMPGNLDACKDDCKLNVCGDGFKSPTELCDDGNDVNSDGCTTACTTPDCGNGIHDQGEDCDDGNNSDNDTCLTTCVYATCGDGKVFTGVEECDNGTANNGATKDCLSTCKTNVCGDGFVDMEGTGASQTEACDLGSFNGQTSCPYGIASCATCTNNCDTSGTGAGPFCGDGIAQTTNGEGCDDRSPTQSCGQCSDSCNAFAAAAPATGIIVATDNSGGNIGDGDTLTLNDGVNSVTFEFDKNAMTTSGNVAIDVSGTLTATQVRDKIATAITTARGLPLLGGGLRISRTSIGSEMLLLTNDRDSSIGNQSIGRTGLGSNFYTSGMSGGAAGDCASGTPCQDDEDCLASDGTGVGTCKVDKTCL